MSLTRSLGGAVIGAAFGAWYAAFKIAGMTDFAIVAHIYQTAPREYILAAGAGVFAVAGFNLARYLRLSVVILAFAAFFVVEFYLPPGSDIVIEQIYLAYLVGALILLLPSLRLFIPTNLFPFVR